MPVLAEEPTRFPMKSLSQFPQVRQTDGQKEAACCWRIARTRDEPFRHSGLAIPLVGTLVASGAALARGGPRSALRRNALGTAWSRRRADQVEHVQRGAFVFAGDVDMTQAERN